jgi:hypothetical protein
LLGSPFSPRKNIFGLVRGATERSGKRGGNFPIGKAPANVIAILMPPASVLWLDATRTVPVMHVIQSFAEATEWHGHFDDVGKFAFD